MLKSFLAVKVNRKIIVEELAQQSKAKTVCVTFGDQGVVAWDGRQYHRAPAYPVEVIDRIGAGDALAAGIISYMAG